MSNERGEWFMCNCSTHALHVEKSNWYEVGFSVFEHRTYAAPRSWRERLSVIWRVLRGTYEAGDVMLDPAEAKRLGELLIELTRKNEP